MDDCKREATQLAPSDLGQPGAKLRAVIVAVTADQLPGPALEALEQPGVHPIACVDDDIRVIDGPPDVLRQVPGPHRYVGIGKEQQANVGPTMPAWRRRCYRGEVC
jgi:hypothetical protein